MNATTVETGIEVDSTVELPTIKARLVGRKASREAGPVSDVIQWFLDYFWVRHAISPGTLDAYRTDLLELERWLATKNKTLVAASPQDIRDFLNSRYRTGYRVLSDLPSLTCIKRFYAFLVSSGLLPEDPTERVFVRTPEPEAGGRQTA